MVQFPKKLSGLLIVGIIVFSACKSNDTSPTDRISVGLHQSARLSSEVTVRVDSIQDSRCPTGVVCIWAGQATVQLVLSKDQDSSTVRLILGPDINPQTTKRLDSTNVSLSNQVYKVILREVNPYPSALIGNQPQTAVVQVTKL